MAQQQWNKLVVATSVVVLLFGFSHPIDAFGIVSSRGTVVVVGKKQCCSVRPSSFLILHNSAENEEVAAEEEEQVSAEVVMEEEQEQEPPEDPEVTALKEEIAQLEKTLKDKNRDLNSIESMVEKYSKEGYARKVAELDQLRKMRRAASQTNQYTDSAKVLTSFLPVLDELMNLDSQYAGDEIAKSYSALKGVMVGAFKDLKAEEFAYEIGDVVDERRVNVVEQVYSDEINKGCIVQTLTTGWELEGNLMRPSNVVASAGSEAEAIAAAAAAEAEAAAPEEGEATE